MAGFRLKRGDTWTFECIRTDSNGVPVDLTGTTIASEIVRDNIKKALIVTLTNPVNGAFTLTLDSIDTSTLVKGVFFGDIEFISDGVVSSSETFDIQLEEDITNAA